MSGDQSPRVLANGTITSTLTGTLILNYDGTYTVTSHGRLTGGTGALKGTKARYTFRGSGNAAGFTLRSTHVVTYPAPNVFPKTCQA